MAVIKYDTLPQMKQNFHLHKSFCSDTRVINKKNQSSILGSDSRAKSVKICDKNRSFIQIYAVWDVKRFFIMPFISFKAKWRNWSFSGLIKKKR